MTTTMLRTLLPILCAAATANAQNPIACFEFDGNSVASIQPASAAVSDLSISNGFQFGGSSSDAWLCLTTQWNTTGGTISFTVTPSAGESINYTSFDWSAVTNNASSTDSVSAMTLLANGVVVGGVDPLTHNTIHELDLSGFAALQAASDPVTFVMDFVGNPTGASSYEMGFIKLQGERCELAISGVSPASLPIVTAECFTLTGDCFAQLTEVMWNGVALTQCTPANWGDGCYTIVGPHSVQVCPPLCENVGSYTIELRRGSEAQTQEVDLVLSQNAALACPPTHPAGTDFCLAVSTGQLPQPNVVFVILSPSDVPSIIPGLIEMSLGNMLTNYFCGPAHISECVEECYNIPPALAGQTWHFQSIVWNPFLTVLPLPVSNMCSTTFN